MSSIATDKDDGEELLTITLKKKDIVSIANALTAGRRLNKWERRKIVAKLQEVTGLTLYDKNNVKEICERRVRKKKKQHSNNDEEIINSTTTTQNLSSNIVEKKPLLNTKYIMNNIQPIIILGCGEISNYYFHSLTKNPGYIVQGIVDIDLNKCKLLAQTINNIQENKYGVQFSYCKFASSLDELFVAIMKKEEEYDTIGNTPIILNLTPAEYHYKTNYDILYKHKCHLYSEKPLASTFAQGVELLELAKRNKLKLAVAPVICYGESQQIIYEYVNNRTDLIGSIKYGICHLYCGSMYPYDFRMKLWKNHRRYKVGSLVDVGVYPLTLLTGIFGNVLAVSCWRKQQDSMDFFTLHLEFKNNFTCVLTTTLSFSENSDKANRLELHGTKGILKLNNVWSFNSKVEYVGDGGNDKIAGTTFELTPFFTPPFNHKNVELSHPIVADWSRGIQSMVTSSRERNNGKHPLHVLEIIEKSEISSKCDGKRIVLDYFHKDEIHFNFDIESNNKLLMIEKNKSSSSSLLSSPSFHKIYPMIYGTMNLAKCEEPLKFLDQAFNMGINTFDLASVYGSKVELLFGKWIESRSRKSDFDNNNNNNNNETCDEEYHGKPTLRNGGFIERNDLFLIGKGGHPFHRSKQNARLHIDDITKDINDSLSNLKCDYFDLYLLHRDDEEMFNDLEIIVKYMNNFIEDGKILNWGTSNWTSMRIKEAISIANKLNLVPPVVESSQFSLAVPSKEIWKNAKSVVRNENDNTHVDLNHVENRVKNHMYFTWASLAEGFLASVDNTIIPGNRMTTWKTECNLKRKARLSKFAEQRSISIAQASVIYSYFYNDAIIIGTSNISHLHEIIHGIIYFYKWKLYNDIEAFDYLATDV